MDSLLLVDIEELLTADSLDSDKNSWELNFPPQFWKKRTTAKIDEKIVILVFINSPLNTQSKLIKIEKGYENCSP